MKIKIKKRTNEAGQRGFKNVTPEPVRSDFTPKKMSSAYGDNEKMIAMDSDSEGKDAIIRLKDKDGDPVSISLNVKDIPDNLVIPTNKEIPVFSVKTDKQIGSLVKLPNQKAKFSPIEKGKKYTTVVGKDSEEIDDLEDDLEAIDEVTGQAGHSTLPSSAGAMSVLEAATDYSDTLSNDIRKIFEKNPNVKYPDLLKALKQLAVQTPPPMPSNK